MRIKALFGTSENAQDTGLDHHRRPCTRRYSQKTAEIRSFSLHYSTDSEPDAIR